MKAILAALILSCAFPAFGQQPPDIYSSSFWEIPGPSNKITWVEIHNRDEAAKSGIAHIEVLARKKKSPVWEIEHVFRHIAITTEALQRSVTRPYKTSGVYPEQFDAGYEVWKKDSEKGTAVICTTSIAEFLQQYR